MAELLLVSNPKRRRRKNPRRRSRRHNPHRSRRRRHNPHRAHRRRRHNPSYRHIRRRRHNPSTNWKHYALGTFREGAWGAGGALANDALFGFITPYLSGFLGANASNGFVQFGLKLASALATGWLAKFAKLPGRELAVGATTVAMHDFFKAQLQTMAPSLFASGGMLALSGYSGMGAYLSGSAPIVGTATFPQAYLPQSAGPGLGAYLSGSSGAVDGSGVYSDDAMGYNYWDGGGN